MSVEKLKYVCGECGAENCKLFRPYQTFLDSAGFQLYCVFCAQLDQRKLYDPSMPGGKHSIGWLVAAVPTEDGTSYWGYTSVPDEGVKWWDELPLISPAGTPPKKTEAA